MIPANNNGRHIALTVIRALSCHLNATKNQHSSPIRLNVWSTKFDTKSGPIERALTANTNIIDFIEIMTTANAVDFGDMLTKTSAPQTCSNAHGGLADDM